MNEISLLLIIINCFILSYTLSQFILYLYILQKERKDLKETNKHIAQYETLVNGINQNYKIKIGRCIE